MPAPEAINFNKDSIFQLKPIEPEKINPMVRDFLIPGETILQGFKTVRDQLIFTNKRIIAVNVQTIDVRKLFTCMPYKYIQYFSVQTPGLLEIISDAELVLHFTNGFSAKFEFQGQTNLGQIVQMISQPILKD